MVNSFSLYIYRTLKVLKRSEYRGKEKVYEEKILEVLNFLSKIDKNFANRSTFYIFN